MVKLSSLIYALGLGLACAGSANAAIVLNDWYFSPNGTGVAGSPPTNAQLINEYLDINGNAFIQINPTSATTFDFTEFAVFNSTQADSNAQLFPLNFTGGNVTATFSGSGSGTFGASFTFASGAIDVYQNPTNGVYGTTAGIYGADQGNPIGTFLLLPGGGGLVDASGTPIANGQITALAQVDPGTVAAGYFFDPAGNDLSTSDTLLAFAFTNANTVGSPTSTMINEIICQGAGFTGPGCPSGTYANVPGSYIFVSNNGQFKLATIPEPATVGLLGLGLLGMGVVGRRRKAS